MQKNVWHLSLIALLFFFPAAVRAEDPSLQVQLMPDQTTVKSGMMFLVRAQVVNASTDTSSEFWGNTCSYERHWVTDNPGVFIQSWTCDENALEQVMLEPGAAYEKNLILYIPKKDKTEPVTFRLGFKRMSENGDVAEPLWGDPVTMQVIVPEEMKAAAPVVVANAAASESAPAAAAEVAEETDTPAAVEPPAQERSGPGTFQDPSVPIPVKPGDEFSIGLASNPSTGFRWKMTLPEKDPTVTFLGSEHVVSEEVMPGVPGTEVFKFKAVTEGETKASFVYMRPWETLTAPPRKIFTILVKEP